VRWLITVIASKCVSLSWQSERWHCYAKGTTLAFSFDIVAFRVHVYRIHSLRFRLQSQMICGSQLVYQDFILHFMLWCVVSGSFWDIQGWFQLVRLRKCWFVWRLWMKYLQILTVR